MKLHKDSHLDHALTQAQIDFLVSQFADRDAFFIETVELPEALGTVPCDRTKSEEFWNVHALASGK